MDYYNKTIDQTYKELDTSLDGLSKAEASHRIKSHGFNELKTKSGVNPFKIFLEQFQSFIVYILLFAVVISAATGHIVDTIIILIILFANAIIGFFQEYSAQKSLEALKQMSIVKAKVYRDNKLIEIDSKHLTLGDIIFLEAGDKVPADARIIEERKLKIEESALTGESLPVSKHSSMIEKKVQISDQKNMIFSGTSLSEGSCKAIVVKIAMNTQIGKISKLIQTAKEEQTPLQKRLDDFGKKLGYAIIVICIFIFIVLLLTKGFSGDNILEFSLIGISLAVAAVPTALPAVVTIALSVGVKRLLKKKALVRKLSSVETLGSCDIICTDKTGTLTQNEMTVKEVWTLNGNSSVTGIGYSPSGTIEEEINPIIFKAGFYCNNASVYKKKNMWTISGDPTEAALIVSARKAKIGEKTLEKIDEIPFDSTRKMMSTMLQNNKTKDLVMYAKGSTTHILHLCTHALIKGKKVKLNDKLKEEINLHNNFYASKALRVLSFAYKDIKNTKEFSEKDLVFIGLQAMQDPPRPDVIESIKKTKKAGIRVIMITGDYKETAKSIGEEIGITGEVLTGQEVEIMSDEELGKALNNNTNIFARVIPEHKQRIVTLLQKQGHIVAMTGDGVNDAPALKKANIGIAVGSGTDVAKEASDLVLLDDSFSNIVNAIEEGRGIYDNIQKSIMLLLSGNFGEVLIIFLAVILGFKLPLTAILLLWINMVTDGAPALAFGVDPYSKNIMKRKPISMKEGILPKSKLILIGALGMIGTIIGLFIFDYFGGNSTNANLPLAQTMIFNFIVLYEVLLIFIIRKQYNVKLISNAWLWFSILITVAFQALVLYTPKMQEWFGVVPIGFKEIGVLVIGGAFFFAGYLVYSLLNKLNKKNVSRNI